MKKQYPFLLISMGVLFFSFSYAQNDTLLTDKSYTKDSIIVGDTGPDQKYREDQFYVGLTYNFITNLPKGAHQSGFSGGVQLGFIRDFPLNKNRNIALGTGLGWSVDSYRTNLMISRDYQGASLFQVLRRSDFDYNVNRFSTYMIEMPLQFRWRTSRPRKQKFWRVYAGFQLGYMYYFQSKFKQPGNKITQTKVDGLKRFRYGATFTFGYNTFNFTVYYSLNPFFDNKTTDGQTVDLTTFKVGLMFYIL